MLPRNLPRILIVGFGNPSRSDDGLGWHIATRLSRELSRADVQVLARQQLTPEIAELASHAEKVLFVDAARDGEPGSLRWRRVLPAASTGSDSHGLSPSAVVRLASDLYGGCPRAFLFTVAGETFETGDAMSQTVEAVVPLLLARIEQFIAGERETGDDGEI